ncbi:hypothetical protein MMC22_009226 [Lobaria immixta]|nr:hypothetical protein [Lobaria immixta]
MKAYDKIKPPQYLVETMPVVSQGLTLTKAIGLVQMEVEWTLCDERQGRKRVNRITQTRPTFTYLLRCEDSIVEDVICKRQQGREQIFQMALTNIDLHADVNVLQVGDKDKADNSDGEDGPSEEVYEI